MRLAVLERQDVNNNDVFLRNIMIRSRNLATVSRLGTNINKPYSSREREMAPQDPNTQLALGAFPKLSTFTEYVFVDNEIRSMIWVCLRWRLSKNSGKKCFGRDENFPFWV